MASNRHLGRVIVLQGLYEYELRTLAGDQEVDLDTVIAKNIEPYEKALGDTEFVYKLAHGVIEHVTELDEALQPMAPEWPISSISAIDRNVLRMGMPRLYPTKSCYQRSRRACQSFRLRQFLEIHQWRAWHGLQRTSY